MHDMELELESEFEMEGEDFLGLTQGIGSLLGESELEYELEGPLGEGPYGEGPLGEGPFGESPLGEFEGESFGLGEGEYEGEFFFKKLKGLISKAAPMLKGLAQKAIPLVAKAVGGPLGGPISAIAGSLLKESELESEYEFEGEGEFEAAASSPLTETQAVGELMAAIASTAASDAEAEAQIGGAVVLSMSARDRDALRSILPALTRGAAVLTRILRARPQTRIAIRTVPTVVKATVSTLKKRAAAGQPITKAAAAKTMARQTQRALTSPRACAHAVQRNAKATRVAAQRTRRPITRESFAY